jgi:cell division control protein 24
MKRLILGQELQHQTKDEELQAYLAGAIELIQGVLHQADASLDKETREEACQDLAERVEDWKSLTMSSFGELMLFGTFTVLKGDGGGKEAEKEVCCEVSPHESPRPVVELGLVMIM